MNYMLTNESLSAAKKAVKMIAKTIAEGLMRNQLVIEFSYEDEAIEIYHHALADGVICLSIYRDDVSSYAIYGKADLEGIRKMASDIFYLLSMDYFNVKL